MLHEMPPESTRLVAVLLITYSKPTGPKLVFHYPPNPRGPHGNKTGAGADSDDESSLDADGLNGVDHLAVHSGLDAAKTNAFKIDAPKDNHQPSSDEKLFDISHDSLEKLLFPGRWCDRAQFQASFGNLIFVGHPIYAREDGTWTKTPRTTADEVLHDRNGHDAHTEPGMDPKERTQVKADRDFTHVPESFDSRGGFSLGTSVNSDTTSTATPEPLTAFHILFATTEHPSKTNGPSVDDMYAVLKQLSKAATHCQRRSSYVGLESRKLSQLKAKAKQDGTSRDTLCSQMIENSELAWALKEIYEKISIEKVAGVRLNNMEISLQVHSPPDEQNDDVELDRHCSVLFTEEREVLLRELSHPDASPLAYFIRESTPTKSLQKQAVKLGMPVANLIYLGQHLIKWRKARAIAPLHPRNIYIVGRNPPLDRLTLYTTEYANRFSGLPSLPQMLAVLSTRPAVKYGVLIPSRDHRAPYMDLLAFLVRHRFVEQLKTSGWLQIPPLVSKLSATDDEPSILSPQLRPTVSDDDTASISSERTAMPVSIAEGLKGAANPSRPSSTKPPEAVSETQAVRILKGRLDTSNEDLQCIIDTIPDAELRVRLPSLHPYFDGETVIEDIAAREGLKRSVLDGWLDTLQEAGLLLTFRHL